MATALKVEVASMPKAPSVEEITQAQSDLDSLILLRNRFENESEDSIELGGIFLSARGAQHELHAAVRKGILETFDQLIEDISDKFAAWNVLPNIYVPPEDER